MTHSTCNDETLNANGTGGKGIVWPEKSTSYLLNYLIGIPIILVIIWQLYKGYAQPHILIASIFFLIICFTDMFFARIPNICNLGLLLTGFGYNVYLSGVQGLAWALLGTLVGLLLFLLPYVAGGMGGGDVKALAALGALSGPTGIFQIFLYTALIGGILAILYYCFTSNPCKRLFAGVNNLRTFIYTKDIQCFKPASAPEKQKFPYASAITLGFFAFTQWGPIVTLLQQ